MDKLLSILKKRDEKCLANLEKLAKKEVQELVAGAEWVSIAKLVKGAVTEKQDATSIYGHMC